MKTIKFFTLTTLFTLLAFNNQTNKAQNSEKKIIAIYKGITVSDNFKFADSKNSPIVFNDEDQSFQSKLSLLDEGLIGKQFVSYKWVDVQLTDKKTGLPNGKTMKMKRIFKYSLK